MKWQTALSFALLGPLLTVAPLAPAAAEPAGAEYLLPHTVVGTQIADKGRVKIRGAGNSFRFKSNQ